MFGIKQATIFTTLALLLFWLRYISTINVDRCSIDIGSCTYHGTKKTVIALTILIVMKTPSAIFEKYHIPHLTMIGEDVK